MNLKKIIVLTSVCMLTTAVQFFLHAMQPGLLVTNKSGTTLNVTWVTETRTSAIQLAANASYPINTNYRDIDTQITEISWMNHNQAWSVNLAMPKGNSETFIIKENGAFESSRLGNGQAKEITIAP